MFHVIILVLCSCAYGHKFDTFVWLDSQKDKELFLKIEKAFANELRPDDVSKGEGRPLFFYKGPKLDPHVPYLYKYIYKVGILGSSAITIIGYREDKGCNTGDVFLAYNYDLDLNTKSEIRTTEEMWVLNLQKLAYFEPSPAPDILFEYKSCTECEALSFISSFQYDRKNKIWKIRSWGENQEAILIGIGIQIGIETRTNGCLYKVQDFNADGFDDIAVRCRIKSTETDSIEDNIKLYTVVKGYPKIQGIEDKSKFQIIQSILCEGKEGHPLCKGKL